MKLSSLFISTAVVVTACGSSKNASTDTLEAKAPTSPVSAITVDGQASDWQSVQKQKNESGTIEYAVANNSDNLYVLFKIADPAEQMKFIRGGMEVWFDPAAKHTKTTEIIYPVKGELPDETFRASYVEGEKPDRSIMHRRIQSGLVSLNRIGFKPEYSGVQSIRENTGFKGAIGWDEAEDLVYEIAIPFAAFPNDVRKAPVEIGFFIGAMDKPKSESGESAPVMQEGGRGMGGGMRGGGGGRRGGSYGGGGQRRGGQQRNAENNPTAIKKLYEPESFWVQYGGK